MTKKEFPELVVTYKTFLKSVLLYLSLLNPKYLILPILTRPLDKRKNEIIGVSYRLLKTSYQRALSINPWAFLKQNDAFFS